MSDAAVRARANDIPVFEFDSLAWTTPKPLAESRVAIVTTAGLRTDTVTLWSQSDEAFTRLPHGTNDLSFAHFSPNFDRSGFNLDLNTVLPTDRLDEMAAAGTIGSVAKEHISFMGAQKDHNLATMRLDTGPAAAELLRKDGVDTILLTPV
jgi:D-proline reductase (dithiol) PrdB